MQFNVNQINGKWIIGSNNTKSMDGLKDWSKIGPSLKIPSIIDGHKIEEIGNMAFYRCTILEDVIIEDGIKQINANGFQDCRNLKSVIIPASIEFIGNHAIHAFNTSSGGTSIGTLVVTFMPNSRLSYVETYGIARKETIIIHYYGKRMPKYNNNPLSKFVIKEVKVFAPYVPKFLGEKTINMRITHCGTRNTKITSVLFVCIMIVS